MPSTAKEPEGKLFLDQDLEMPMEAATGWTKRLFIGNLCQVERARDASRQRALIAGRWR